MGSGVGGGGQEGMLVPSVTVRLVVLFMEKKKCRGKVFYFGHVEFVGPWWPPGGDVSWAVAL